MMGRCSMTTHHLERRTVLWALRARAPQGGRWCRRRWWGAAASMTPGLRSGSAGVVLPSAWQLTEGTFLEVRQPGRRMIGRAGEAGCGVTQVPR